MINLINLPSPRPLLPSLLEAGFCHEIATTASKLYQKRAEEFKRRTEASIIVACRKIGTLPDASVSPSDSLMRIDISTFTEVYLRYLEEWKKEMVQLLRQAPKVPSRAAPSRNFRSFNYEYLPLLEHFFEENPFPTHADKVFLAEKSRMQYKQIHVWFQNRRNRTKKEGKALRRKPISEGAMKPLGLVGRMKGCVAKSIPHAVRPSRVSVLGEDDQLRVTRDNASKCAFAMPPPPHAFPSTYPPICAYDPFPCTSGPIYFKQPEWRAPCLKPPPSISISIDDLTEMFSRLNVRCNARIKGFPKLRSPAATAAITVIPSRAPHPSLTISKQITRAGTIPHCPLVRTSASRPCAFQSSNPIAKPVVLVPPSAPLHRSEPSAKRKTAPLPRRFPEQVQDGRRDTTPSEYSSASSSSHVFSAGPTSRSSFLSSAYASSPPRNLESI